MAPLNAGADSRSGRSTVFQFSQFSSFHSFLSPPHGARIYTSSIANNSHATAESPFSCGDMPCNWKLENVREDYRGWVQGVQRWEMISATFPIAVAKAGNSHYVKIGDVANFRQQIPAEAIKLQA